MTLPERIRNTAELALEEYTETLAQALARHAPPQPPPALQGYLGRPCGSCGAFRLRPSGTCGVCDNCGSSGGCS